MKPSVARRATPLGTAVLLLLMAVSSQVLHAQDGGLAFLRIGTNAEAGALGDAGVATNGDVFAAYWNPAGLAAPRTNAVALSQLLWVADVRAYALAARFRAGPQGGLGVFFTSLDAGDFEARQGPSEEPDGLFGAQFLNLSVAYGRALGPLNVGVTAKYLVERIFTNEATGYAFDLGAQLRLLSGSLNLGAAIQNVGEMTDLSDEATPLPRLVRAGVAVEPFQILAQDDGTPLLDLAVVADVSHVFDDDATRVHVGTAATLLDLIVARAGLITNDDLRGPTFGLGLVYAPFQFDYAYLPFDEGFADTGHVLTLRYQW
ncbi:MAG: PorV/PorQ family protein [Bacteroidota bacterium]